MAIRYFPKNRKPASVRTPFWEVFHAGHAYASSGVARLLINPRPADAFGIMEDARYLFFFFDEFKSYRAVFGNSNVFVSADNGKVSI